MFAARITLPHFSVSAAMSLRARAGMGFRDLGEETSLLVSVPVGSHATERLE
jgi:hypothetical protein